MMYYVIEWRLNEYQISLICKNPYLSNAIVIRSGLNITYYAVFRHTKSRKNVELNHESMFDLNKL